MTSVPVAEPLRSALTHFDSTPLIARDRQFDRTDFEGRRDRYAIEGALYLGAAAIASASGWLLRHPPSVRRLAYSVVDLSPLQVDGEELPPESDLRFRLQAARVVAALILSEDSSDARDLVHR